jgi:hypothetical protein
MTIDGIRRKAVFKKSELHITQNYERFRELSTKNWDVTLEDDTVEKKPLGALVLTREEAHDHKKWLVVRDRAVRENRPIWIESEE